jgi:hypothetical protein
MFNLTKLNKPLVKRSTTIKTKFYCSYKTKPNFVAERIKQSLSDSYDPVSDLLAIILIEKVRVEQGWYSFWETQGNY